MSLFATIGGFIADNSDSDSSGGSMFSGAVQGVVGQASAGIGSIIGTAVGGITSIFQGVFSGATGAARVEFINDANPKMTGPAYWHGKGLALKWRDMDAFLKAFNGGKGLESFGWELNKTPSSASAKFKGAENRFFEVVDQYCQGVASGAIQHEVWLDIPDVNNRIASFSNAGVGSGSTNGFTIDLPNGGGTSGATNSSGGSDMTTILTYVGVGLTLLSFMKK